VTENRVVYLVALVVFGLFLLLVMVALDGDRCEHGVVEIMGFPRCFPTWAIRSV
jgi:hypothetical protein